MTGLEKIIQEIERSAQAEADSILTDAKTEADSILSKDTAKLTAQIAEITTTATKKAEELQKRGSSNVDLQHRQNMLKVKQELIADTLFKAEQAVAELSTEEYFSIFALLAEKVSPQGEVTLQLNEKDLARLPSTFVGMFPPTLNVSVSPIPANIAGGFLLSYGDIVANCSLEAVFSQYKDQFSDTIQRILFDA